MVWNGLRQSLSLSKQTPCHMQGFKKPGCANGITSTRSQAFPKWPVESPNFSHFPIVDTPLKSLVCPSGSVSSLITMWCRQLIPTVGGTSSARLIFLADGNSQGLSLNTSTAFWLKEYWSSSTNLGVLTSALQYLSCVKLECPLSSLGLNICIYKMVGSD